MTAKTMLAQASLLTKVGEQQEVYEFVRISMVEQHELLAVILCAAIEKRHAEVRDFKEFLAGLKKADKYDHLLGKFLCTLVFGVKADGVG
jgi:nuclear pore complex protein Nup205